MGEAQCYAPDGTPSVIGTPWPCFDTTDGLASACCNLADSVCTEGGYCLGSAGLAYRGGCTDRTWASPRCPLECSKVALDTFCNIVPCQGAFSYTGGGAFCCAGNSTYDSTCCDSSFYFSQSDVGKPFVPASFNATLSAASIRSTVTSYSTATAVSTLAASSTGPNAKVVGLAVGLPLGLTAAVSCAAAVILYRDSQRSKRKLGKLQDARTSYSQSEPELHESSKSELHAVAKQGLPGDQRRHELH